MTTQGNILAAEPVTDSLIDAPPAIDYARPGAYGLDPAARAALRVYANTAVWLAVFSGLCVAACFVTMATYRGDPVTQVAGTLLHLGVYVTTLALGARAGFYLRKTCVIRSAVSQRLVLMNYLDAVAAVGLILIGSVPLWMTSTRDPTSTSVVPLAIGFWCFALTTYRHLLLGRGLTEMSRELSGRTGGLTALGWTKAVYEFVWLTITAFALTLAALQSRGGGDSAVLLAFGSFFGCFGYGVLWVWMIVASARLRSRVGNETEAK